MSLVFEFNKKIIPEDLGSDQRKAYTEIIDFLEDPSARCFVCAGSAGTGKSYLESKITEYLDKKRIDYCLCAPTHKAALVIYQYTKRYAVTLHKLLNLSPVVDILYLDLDNLKFAPNKSSYFPRNGLIILDEASMVNDDLYDLLMDKCSQFNTKLLAFMDHKQLAPVKQRELSKIYSCPNKITLNEIFRQSKESGVMESLYTLRNTPIMHFLDNLNDEGSLVTIDNPKGFLHEAAVLFSEAIEEQNVLKVKIASYTNNRVNQFNDYIHNTLFPNTEYSKGEILTCYDNLDMFNNSMDYIVTDVSKEPITIPDIGTYPGYVITLLDPLTKLETPVKMLSKTVSNKDLEFIGETIETIRVEAIKAKAHKSPNSSRLWSQYYNIIGSFCTPKPIIYDSRVVKKKSFDYGYACTIHKLLKSLELVKLP